MAWLSGAGVKTNRISGGNADARRTHPSASHFIHWIDDGAQAPPAFLNFAMQFMRNKFIHRRGTE